MPALIVGLILFFSPRNYEVTYVYDVKERSIYDMRGQSGYDTRNRSYDVSNWNLDEKNYNVLLDRFYSEENLNKITNKLRENGVNTINRLGCHVGYGGNSLLCDLAIPAYYATVPIWSYRSGFYCRMTC